MTVAPAARAASTTRLVLSSMPVFSITSDDGAVQHAALGGEVVLVLDQHDGVVFGSIDIARPPQGVFCGLLEA